MRKANRWDKVRRWYNRQYFKWHDRKYGGLEEREDCGAEGQYDMFRGKIAEDQESRAISLAGSEYRTHGDDRYGG